MNDIILDHNVEQNHGALIENGITHDGVVTFATIADKLNAAADRAGIDRMAYMQSFIEHLDRAIDYSKEHGITIAEAAELCIPATEQEAAE